MSDADPSLWEKIAVGAAGLAGGLSLLLYSGIHRRIDAKADQSLVDEQRRRQDKMDENLGRLYSRVNDAIVDVLREIAVVKEMVNEHHLRLLEKIQDSKDKD